LVLLQPLRALLQLQVLLPLLLRLLTFSLSFLRFQGLEGADLASRSLQYVLNQANPQGCRTLAERTLCLFRKSIEKPVRQSLRRSLYLLCYQVLPSGQLLDQGRCTLILHTQLA
jgi:hypothetical protein